jgi:hypothetical protein
LSEEQKLIEKLQRIEALFAGATTKGEKVAAANALERIREKLNDVQKLAPPVEYKFTLTDIWSRSCFWHCCVATALSLTAITDRSILLSWLVFPSAL